MRRMMCDSSSTHCTTLRARSPSAAAATPNIRENTTICRISLRAIASKAEVGTRCATKSLSESDEARTLALAPTSGRGRFRLLPGCRRFTSTRPSSSDTKEAQTNHSIALAPIRPTDLVSPMWATPTTRVENTSGAMIILIRRRKMSLKSEM